MSEILISGLINIETTLRVAGFPIEYQPVLYPFYGVSTTVSGVGYNVARALQVLGDQPRLLALIGQDTVGDVVLRTMRSQNLRADGVISSLERTPQSVILYDASGRRQINVDLKDIQDRSYPTVIFTEALQDCRLAVLANINFSRPFLQAASKAERTVATDVHTISSLEDEYNRDFMQAASILFMSDEKLPCPPTAWLKQLMERYPAQVAVVGMGAKGAMLAVRGAGIERLPAVHLRPVTSTIGAGDALFSAFIHFYIKDSDPFLALDKAIHFAAYKIGSAGAAEGFLDEAGLLEIYHERPRSPGE
jgi:acarbose 7IV-phosphotransferase